MAKTNRLRRMLIGAAVCGAAALALWRPARRAFAEEKPDPASDHSARMLAEGRQTFRFDTFGDEAFWGDKLKLHQAIEGSRFGGVGAASAPGPPSPSVSRSTSTRCLRTSSRR